MQPKRTLTKKFWLVVLASCLGAALLVNKKIEDRLAGVCSETGTILSVEAKRQRVIEEINWIIDLENEFKGLNEKRNEKRPNGRKNQIYTVKHSLRVNYPEKRIYIEDNYKIIRLDKNDINSLKLTIFPEIPDFAKDKKGFYVGYYNGIGWDPVPNYYKIIGYAYDYIFIEMNLSITPTDGSNLIEKLHWRSWTDACGNFAKVPEKYIVG